MARAAGGGSGAGRRRARPFVDVDDIADVAVAALTAHGTSAQLYELTGPRLLTFARGGRGDRRATGGDGSVLPIPVDEHAAGTREQGVPADVVELLKKLFSEVLDGRNAHLADGVQRALGREPRDFDFARRAGRRASGRAGGGGLSAHSGALSSECQR